MKVLRATAENIERVAEALREGRIAIIPTETVYGIAASALQPEAVRRVFEAKGRPQDNPLIVHVASASLARELVAEWPDEAEILSKRFWPGPLTLVLRKSSLIPPIVTGGLETVAIRVPAHGTALAVLEAAGTPLAAPSANRFMGLSATRVENLDPGLIDRVQLVLDDGPCPVGLESTVVDLSGPSPSILRPGGVTRADVQAALGRPLSLPLRGGPRRSPGRYRRHYAPETRLTIVDAILPGACGLRFGVPENPNQIRMPREPAPYGAALYAALALLDRLGEPEIQVEAPPDTPEWEAIWDRLRRAAG